MTKKLPGCWRAERFIACARAIRAACLQADPQRPFIIAHSAKSVEEGIRIYPTRDPAQGPAPPSEPE